MENSGSNTHNTYVLSESETRREWFVGVLGALVCYGLIIWLCGW